LQIGAAVAQAARDPSARDPIQPEAQVHYSRVTILESRSSVSTNTTTTTESRFPKKETDGRGIYYACCISNIGPACQHITMPDGTIRLPLVQPEDTAALEESWAVSQLDNDLQVSYSDIRESLTLILGVTTDPKEILASLDDAVSNNLGD
jgi:hypothetical protein